MELLSQKFNARKISPQRRGKISKCSGKRAICAKWTMNKPMNISIFQIENAMCSFA